MPINNSVVDIFGRPYSEIRPMLVPRLRTTAQIEDRVNEHLGNNVFKAPCHRPLNPDRDTGYCFVVALDMGPQFLYVLPHMLENWGVSFGQVVEDALENLDKMTRSAGLLQWNKFSDIRNPDSMHFATAWKDLFCAERILLPETIAPLHSVLNGDIVVSFRNPRPGETGFNDMYVCGSKDVGEIIQCSGVGMLPHISDMKTRPDGSIEFKDTPTPKPLLFPPLRLVEVKSDDKSPKGEGGRLGATETACAGNGLSGRKAMHQSRGGQMLAAMWAVIDELAKVVGKEDADTIFKDYVAKLKSDLKEDGPELKNTLDQISQIKTAQSSDMPGKKKNKNKKPKTVSSEAKEKALPILQAFSNSFKDGKMPFTVPSYLQRPPFVATYQYIPYVADEEAGEIPFPTTPAEQNALLDKVGRDVLHRCPLMENALSKEDLEDLQSRGATAPAAEGQETAEKDGKYVPQLYRAAPTADENPCSVCSKYQKNMKCGGGSELLLLLLARRE
ncbi:hypothetical protein HK104_009634 [Borealophlyctis nickersoniae]|nr:hypothetical protein HK104_009634 [Borealophlyctis nickersoniae]